MATYVSWATKAPRGQNYDNALLCVKNNNNKKQVWSFKQNQLDRDNFGLKVSSVTNWPNLSKKFVARGIIETGFPMLAAQRLHS